MDDVEEAHLDALGKDLLLESDSLASTHARRFLTSVLSGAPQPFVTNAAQVLTELVTNGVLHGAPPLRVRIREHETGVRLEVFDTERRPPLQIRDAGHAMTGRGLSLVAALSSAWGVEHRDDGKVVWADVPRDEAEAGSRAGTIALHEPLAEAPHVDGSEKLFTVQLGDVPTELLLAAKSHVDNLVREFILATGGETPPVWLEPLVESVVQDFALARQQIKEQAVAAAANDAVLTHLVLQLPASAAAAGERYLLALDEADRFARNARLLTLEAPPVHKIFRRWYVEALIDQLRSQVKGVPAPRPRAFAERLADEYTRLEPLRQTAIRLQMIQKVTADLAAAGTLHDAALTVVNNALDLLQADVALVYVMESDGLLHAVRRPGVGDEDLLSQFDAFSLDADLPGAAALRKGEPMIFRSTQELVEQFPQLNEADFGDDMRLLVAPLLAGDKPLGVIALRFLGTSQVDDEAQLSMLSTLAGVTAQAMERSLATSAATEAAERLSLLAEASSVLASSLDHREVLQRLADVLVPRLADWCSVHLVEDGELVTVAFVHRDPGRTEWVRAMENRRPLDSDAVTGATYVARTGKSELYPDVSSELIDSTVEDLEHRRIVNELGTRSALTVPLRGRTGVIGALVLASGESTRRLGPADLALAEDLARRTAVAIETLHAFSEQSARLAHVLRVAEAAQHAILAAPPNRIGAYGLAARYISAAAEALVGGDMYEVTRRPGAVRLLIGDVRGKGLEAVRLATIVLGEFRAAAADLDDLAAVARQIDRRVRNYLSEEDFVTALIADLNDTGDYTLISCGHPSPLLFRSGGGVSELEIPSTLPLGLGVDPTVATGRLAEGDRLLLYTDGLIEARDTNGRFVDLMELTAPLVSAPLDHVLDEVLKNLQAKTGGPLNDDLALLIAEHRP